MQVSRVGPLLRGIGLELGGEEDGELGRTTVAGRRANKKLPAEQVVPGELSHDADGERELRIGSDQQVLHVRVLPLPEIGGAGVETLELGLAHRLVDGAPLDILVRGFVTHDELVFGGAAGELPGADDERTVGRERALPALQRLLQQLGARDSSRPR